ncbi:MAG TPA: phosphatidate cytidylyltransferase [Firmicutes bacterium]|nr:phosphatidate cytidylyltransferase [Bacillota bacterium]
MKARVLVGLVGAPIGLLVLWVGGVPLAVTMLLVAGVGAYEYALMCRTKAWSPSAPLIVVASSMFVVDAMRWGGSFSGLVLAFILLGSLLLEVARGRPVNSVGGPALEVFGSLYCGWTLSRFCLIRCSLGDAGLGLALLFVVSVWMNDMGAFFTGKAFGRRKLAPGLSPKKTVEGAIGGFVWAALASAVFKALGDASGLWYTLDWLHAIILALTIAACGQLGDLAESAMKRDTGIKDTGWIFPGHGGVLDRFDSFFFACPVAYYYLILLIPGLGGM